MRNFFAGLVVFTVFAALSFLLVLNEQKNKRPFEERNPSSYSQVARAIQQISADIENPKVFNVSTAANYINEVATQAYALRAADFLPATPQENAVFERNAEALAKTLFSIRIRLIKKLGEFEQSPQWNATQQAPLIESFRRAVLYLSYAEDYVIQRVDHVRPLESRDSFFKGEGLLNLVNPEFADRAGKFQLKAGDVFLVRGHSFFSATIARIGDMPTNYSHSAMVVETENGGLRVVEALLEKNMISYSVEEYLALERLPRAAVYRFHDPVLARQAGIELWQFYQNQKANPLLFDISMNVRDHSKVYCFESIFIAFDRASRGKVKIPRYETPMSRVAKTDFSSLLGLSVDKLSAPADIILDSRFTLVAEHRDPKMLDESRRYDVVASKLFELFQQGFTYKSDIAADGKAALGIFLRTFGLMKDSVPVGVEWKNFASLIRHKHLVTDLMKQLENAEREVQSKTGGLPLSYQESEVLFDRVCGTSCVRKKAGEISARPLRLELARTEGAGGAGIGGRCEMLFKPSF